MRATYCNSLHCFTSICKTIATVVNSPEITAAVYTCSDTFIEFAVSCNAITTSGTCAVVCAAYEVPTHNSTRNSICNFYSTDDCMTVVGILLPYTRLP